jgi:3-hydroxybutyryl-CoA dehydrogenase
MSDRGLIVCLGAGRMGRGIAVVFAYAGYEVAVVDFKQREAPGFERLADAVREEVRTTFASLARFGLFDERAVDRIAARVSVVNEREAQQALSSAAVIFEGVPEVLDLKRAALARAATYAGPAPIIASTTSTILVDDLSDAVAYPERFLNAHWLNPAYLVPLVELSRGPATSYREFRRLR